MAGRPIDEKIVAMKMDNSDFKRKAMETSTLFSKLRDSLSKIPGVNMDKITNSFAGIQKAANGTDLTGLARNVDQIAGRFSNLGVIATTALANITNKAVNAGTALYKSLTVTPVMDGFREYENKMGSIGTMLANTEWAGSTLKDVKKTLGELNDYADNTIYSFEQMTANIGRFTAAGVTLEDSAIAIKGLGNLAAISGSNTEQLNTAMYQMSQALASGKLNLMDWNSLVNAGMAGKKTQDALVKTAKAMGKNVDMSEGFRNSIQDGWLTSEVFLETLKKFGKDESMTKAATSVRTFTGMMAALREGIGSGWAETWEIIFGDFEEATKFWTAISDTVSGFFKKQTDARNNFLRAVFDGDGFKNVLGGLKNIVTPFAQIFKAIGAGFKLAFPPSSAGVIKSMVEGFKNLTAGMAFSEKTVGNITAIFEGLFSILAIGWKIIKGGASIFIELLGSFEGLGAKIMELIAKVAMIPTAFNDTTNSGEAFQAFVGVLRKVFDALAATLEFVVDGLILFVGAVGAAWTALSTGDFSGGPWEKESEIGGKLENIRNKVIDVVNGIKQAWKALTTGDFAESGPWSADSFMAQGVAMIGEGFRDLGRAIASIELSDITSAIGSFVGFVKDGFTWIIDTAKAVGTAIKDMLPSGNELFAGGFIAGMIGIVGMALKMAWDLYEVFTGWGSIGDGVSEVLEGVSDSLNAFTWSIRAQALLTIAIAIGVLSAGLWTISSIPVEKIGNTLSTLIISLGALVGAMIAMDKWSIGNTGLSTAVQVLALAVAFSILAGALKKVSDMNWNELIKGIVGLVAVMGAFTGALVLMSKFGGPSVGASALQMVAVAGTVYLLVLVIKKIADINTGSLVKGMTGLAAALAIFAGAMIVISKFGGGQIGASALQMVAMAGSVLLLVQAIKQIADIKTGDLVKGLTTVGLILAAIATFAVVTKNAGLMSAGVGITLLAVALNLLIIPIAALGNMSLETLAKGLGAMTIALIAIAAASKLMTGMIAAGAGLLIVAAALNAFIIPITTLGVLPIGVLATGIIALAGAILLIGGAAALLGLAGPALLMGAAGIAALGVAMLAAGLGISLFSTGLVTLAAMTGAAVTTIVATLGTLIIGLASLIPSAVNFVMKLIQHMATALVNNIPTLANKMLQIILRMLDVIAVNIPKFGEAATKIITNFLDSLAENLPKIVESASNLMISFVEALTAAVTTDGPRFINAILDLFAEVLIIVVQAGAAVVEALFGWIPGVSDAADSIGENAESSIRDAFDAAKAGTDKGDDFTGALAGKAGAAGSAGSKVANSAKSGAAGVKLASTGSGAGAQFASGLGSKTGAASSSGRSLANSGKSGASGVNLRSTGNSFASGFVSGIADKYNAAVSAARNLASRASNAVKNWLNINSPSRLLRGIGNSFGEGFSMGIHDGQKDVVNEATSMAQSASKSVNDFIRNFSLPDADNEIHFKAVVDYDALDTSRFGTPGAISVRPNTALTTGLAESSRADIVTAKVRSIAVSGQNGNIDPELRKKQEEQIELQKETNKYLFNISKKDNSLYLDGKEIYNTNKNFQDNATQLRNLFKGVNPA